jgi:hypothetical protein
VIVHIPANWVVAGRGLPDVCAAHGNPVALRRQTRIESSPPGWVWALLPFGLLIFFIVRAALRKAVIAPSWGFCRDCVKSQVTRLITGLALLAGGILSLFASALADDTSVSESSVGIGILLLIIGYVSLRISAGEVIARTRLTQDGWNVEVRDPAPVFAAQVEAALSAASVHALR